MPAWCKQVIFTCHFFLCCCEQWSVDRSRLPYTWGMFLCSLMVREHDYYCPPDLLIHVLPWGAQIHKYICHVGFVWTGAHQVLILHSYESCFTVIRYEGLCGSAIIRGLGSLATDLIWTNDTFTSYKNKHSMPALSDTNIFTLYVHNYPPGLPAREYFVFLKATAAFTHHFPFSGWTVIVKTIFMLHDYNSIPSYCNFFWRDILDMLILHCISVFIILRHSNSINSFSMQFSTFSAVKS